MLKRLAVWVLVGGALISCTKSSSEWTPSEITQEIFNCYRNRDVKRADSLRDYFDLTPGTEEVRTVWKQLHDERRFHEGDHLPLIVDEMINNSKDKAWVFTIYRGSGMCPGIDDTFLFNRKSGRWVLTEVFYSCWVKNFARNLDEHCGPVTEILRELVEAEEKLKTNDLDGNGFNDYWVGDVAGLWWLKNKENKFLKLIPLAYAQADYKPLPGYEPWKAEIPAEPLPHDYHLMALGINEDGKSYRINGGNYNPDKYGFIAFRDVSAEPNERGRWVAGYVFIINQLKRIYVKDLNQRLDGPDGLPKELVAWPQPDPISAGWRLYNPNE